MSRPARRSYILCILAYVLKEIAGCRRCQSSPPDSLIELKSREKQNPQPDAARRPIMANVLMCNTQGRTQSYLGAMSYPMASLESLRLCCKLSISLFGCSLSRLTLRSCWSIQPCAAARRTKHTSSAWLIFSLKQHASIHCSSCS